MLLGAAIALGLALVVSGLVPARVPLSQALAQLDREPAPIPEPGSWWLRWVARPIAGTALGRAAVSPVRADLGLIGRTPEEHLARHVLIVVVALCWAPFTFGLMAAGGISVSWNLPVWLSVVLAVVALPIPTLAVRQEAAARRRSFRHAFGCFLDLVSVRLAGGAGVDSALAGAAAAGEGWAFAALRRCLTEARLRGEPSWSGLARLGQEIGVPELEELAASASLAGDEGARVRQSITAKARSLRLRGLTDAEGAAQAASERMSLPVVLLMTGFIVFLGYPAVAQVIGGL